MFYFFPFRQVVGTRLKADKHLSIGQLTSILDEQVLDIIPAVLSMFTSALGEVCIQRMSEAIREFVHKKKCPAAAGLKKQFASYLLT